MLSKIVSNAHVQWSQTGPWYQVSVSCCTRWLVCIHVRSSKWKSAWFISHFFKWPLEQAVGIHAISLLLFSLPISTPWLSVKNRIEQNYEMRWWNYMELHCCCHNGMSILFCKCCYWTELRMKDRTLWHLQVEGISTKGKDKKNSFPYLFKHGTIELKKKGDSSTLPELGWQYRLIISKKWNFLKSNHC